MDGRTEWASEGKPKQVGEPELALREQGRRMMVRKSGRVAPSRVAPQERFLPLLSQHFAGTGVFFAFVPN